MIVDVSSLCLYIVAPILVVQKAKLRRLGTLRQAQNSLREQVNQLSFAIEKLKTQNIELDLQATELSKVTSEYTRLSQQYGSQVDRLMAIVKENGEIQDKIKKNLEVQVMQSALDTILKCDTDEDFAISQDEIPQMQLRLSKIKGVEFDKANFDRLFKKNKGELKLKEIMEMFRNLKDDIPEEENIFHLKPEKLAPTTPRSRSFLGF
jgi:chromosome segregation ATPase